MPVFHDISLNLEMDQLLRRQEIGARSELRPKFTAILHELLDKIDELHLLEPAIAYEFRQLSEVWPDCPPVKENGASDSPASSILSSAKELAVVVCTIGPRLEEKVRYFSNSGEPLRALMLDGIGSAAVDSLSQEACRLIGIEASSRGYQAGSPLGPGMPGMPISDQKQLFHMAPAERIGVSLTSRQVMNPQKSVSMVIGIGPEMPTWSLAVVCARCSLKKTCLHRYTGKPREISK